jgi:hypothetical protein
METVSFTRMADGTAADLEPPLRRVLAEPRRLDR